MAAEPTSEEEVKGGELLLCGSTAWDHIGRKTATEIGGALLLSPTRLRPLMGVPIVYVGSGSGMCASILCVYLAASCHSLAVDVNGRCFTWGRNERGQLGHGDLVTRDVPTLVSGLSKYKIVKAAAGRHFSVVVTNEGDSFAFGCNKHGQLGSGSTKNDIENTPVKCLISKAVHAACGAEFTVWLTSTPGSTILTAGLPQYGQLGHGTDHQYNAKESSVRMVYEPQPRPKAIAKLTEKMIVKVACGNNHTVAVDSDGNVYTWGYGGHGRLGHREQKDEFTPRIVDLFQRHNLLPPTAVVAAGAAFSACTASGGQLYMWGRVKNTGDNWMYPKPVYDLSGWAIQCMASGEKSTFAGAEKSCISWGTSVYGELGYGPLGPKSSASPKKVDLLEGMDVLSVACGVGHSLIVVDPTGVEDRIEKLDVYESTVKVPESANGKGENSEKSAKKGSKSQVIQVEPDLSKKDKEALKSPQTGEKKKRGRPSKSADQSPAKKQKEAPPRDDAGSDGSEDDDDGDEDSEASDESGDSGKGGSKGRGKGRGRGRGSGRGKNVSKKGDTGEPKKSGGRGRGRGRGQKAET
ncbi:hypothetical protein KP509_1Z205300 [Ceratopteris richardii]|nr:hypothetical protein KP509_1Z205300 [Ceratopteris richardii]